MLKKIIFILLTILITQNVGFSQNRAGYLGKKNLVSVSITSNIRVFQLLNSFMQDDVLLNTVSFDENNLPKKRFSIFRIDYHFSYQRIISNRLAIGLEYAYNKTTVGSNNFFFYSSTYGNFSEYSSPIFRAQSYLLTFEVFEKKLIAGNEFSFMFGIGPKTFSFKGDENYRLSTEVPIPENHLYEDKKINFWAVNAFYQINYRHPINRFLSFEIGLRLRTGFVLKKNHNPLEANPNSITYFGDEVWDSEVMYKAILLENAFNLASLKTGLVFVF